LQHTILYSHNYSCVLTDDNVTVSLHPYALLIQKNFKLSSSAFTNRCGVFNFHWWLFNIGHNISVKFEFFYTNIFSFFILEIQEAQNNNSHSSHSIILLQNFWHNLHNNSEQIFFCLSEVTIFLSSSIDEN